MKSIRRLAILALCAAFALGLFGCERFAIPPINVPKATVLPSKASGIAASKALSALDEKLFEEYVTGDILTYRLMVADPSSFPFEAPEDTWGSISHDEYQRRIATAKEDLNALYGIDRMGLSDAEKLTYDTFEQYLQGIIASEPYYYYEEILSPYDGIHTNLAFNLTLFPIHDSADANSYLNLLDDAKRMIKEVLSFEQGKSKAGLFMTDAACDEILGQLKEFIDSGDNCYLYDTFEEAIGEAKIGGAEAESLVQRNRTLVAGLLDAYQGLYDGLKALRGTNTNASGLAAYGAEGLRYFETGLMDAACTEITPEEAYDLLNEELTAEYKALVAAITSAPDSYDLYGTVDLSLGDAEDNLAHLESIMGGYYPELPPHAVAFTEVPKALEGQFSPAAYLIPPVDAPNENLIIINEKSMAESYDLLPTLAHEGYPGHMYQYIYQRGLTDTGLMRKVMSLTGYYESWAMSAEDFFDSHTDDFDNDYCTMMTKDSNISGLIMPAMSSIGVNYLGWSVDDVQEFLAVIFGDAADEQTAKAYYDVALKDPFYYIEYAMGYSKFNKLVREYQEQLGDGFDQLAFNQAYLELGPSYFNLLEERMDAWAAQQ